MKHYLLVIAAIIYYLNANSQNQSNFKQVDWGYISPAGFVWRTSMPLGSNSESTVRLHYTFQMIADYVNVPKELAFVWGFSPAGIGIQTSLGKNFVTI